MRFLITTLLIICSLNSSFSQIEKNFDNFKNTIKLDPLAIPFLTFGIKYERNLAETKSIQFGYLYVGGPDYLANLRSSGTGWFGSIFTVEYRLFYKVKNRFKETTITESEYRNRLREEAKGSNSKKKWRHWSSAWYIAPYVRYQTLDHVDFDGVIYSINTFGGGGVIGKLIRFTERFSLDLYIGLNYQSGVQEFRNNGGSTEWFSHPTGGADFYAPKAWFGWGPRLGASIGFSF